MLHILLTNDDGYQALGIRTLFSYLKTQGYKVTMIAPRSERSAQSHAMSFYQAVHVEQIEDDIFAVSGTPADCAAIGLACILKNNPPDIVVSGINHGLNVGIDVNYSGTVGAATEAALMGFKALAVSFDSPQCTVQNKEQGFLKAAQLAGKILKNISAIEWPKLQVLNLNVPVEFNGVKVAQCGGSALYVPYIEELPSAAHKEIKVYVIGGLGRHTNHVDPSQDVSVVSNGFASVSFVSTKQSSTSNNVDLEKVLGTVFS